MTSIDIHLGSLFLGITIGLFLSLIIAHLTKDK